MFDGLEDLKIDLEHHYIPGSRTLEDKLADMLIRVGKEKRAAWLTFMDHVLDQDKYRVLFDPDLFLEEYILALRKEDLVMEPDNHLSCFLTPMIQFLYNNGYNYFHVKADDWTPSSIAGHLTGTEEFPLNLVYVGNVENFGRRSRNCVMTVKGNVEYAGYKSESSSYKIEGKAEVVGGSAKDCEFYHDSLFQIYGTDYLHTKLMKYIPRECRFHVRNGITKEEKDKLWTSPKYRWWKKPKNVFRHGKNTLLVPGKKPDTWKEVSP